MYESNGWNSRYLLSHSHSHNQKYILSYIHLLYSLTYSHIHSLSPFLPLSLPSSLPLSLSPSPLSLSLPLPPTLSPPPPLPLFFPFRRSANMTAKDMRRAECLRVFNDDPACSVALGTMNIAGVGLNLTIANVGHDPYHILPHHILPLSYSHHMIYLPHSPSLPCSEPTFVFLL